MTDPTNTETFSDYKDFDHRIRDMHNQNEASIFFKDDWKALKSLTLNLGMRWAYFSVPWESNGLMPLPVGGGDAMFGISGRSWDGWMRPGQRADVTTLQFVGKGSPNPDIPWYPNDWNNFGPAVGFSWQVPWFGEGKTTVRGGYQITYQINQSGNNIIQEINAPGASDIASLRARQQRSVPRSHEVAIRRSSRCVPSHRRHAAQTHAAESADGTPKPTDLYSGSRA